MTRALLHRAIVIASLLATVPIMTSCMGLSGSQHPSGSGTGSGSNATNPTATITVTPTTVQQGGTVTVSWQTQNATGVSLTQNGTSIPLEGSPLNSSGMTFTLNAAGKTFALTATGAPGTTPASSHASVTVTAAPPSGPTASLTVTPTTVQAGQSFALSWTTKNATSVSLTQNGTNVPIGTGQTTATVTLNSVGASTFVLTATGAQGATATSQASVQVTPASNPGDVTAINHIIFMSEENRSFDVYLGKLNEYRAKSGLEPDVDGLPDDCSSSNSDWTKQCSAMNKAPNAAGSPTTPIYAFHLKTMCIENTSADWIVSHWAFNAESPSSDTPLLDGFVIGAASATAGTQTSNPTIPDKQGHSRYGLLHVAGS